MTRFAAIIRNPILERGLVISSSFVKYPLFVKFACFKTLDKPETPCLVREEKIETGPRSGYFYRNFDRAGKSSFYISVNRSTRHSVLCACANALGSFYIAIGGECFFRIFLRLKTWQKRAFPETLSSS